MKPSKRERLRRAGFKVGSAADFLGLSAQEQELIDLKLDLVNGVKALRTEQKLSQAALAKLLGSSQSRIANLEAGDPSVSLDLLLRALLSLGSSRKRIATMFVRAPRKKSAA